jgi:hypothetical protein
VTRISRKTDARCDGAWQKIPDIMNHSIYSFRFMGRRERRVPANLRVREISSAAELAKDSTDCEAGYSTFLRAFCVPLSVVPELAERRVGRRVLYVRILADKRSNCYDGRVRGATERIIDGRIRKI